MVDTFLDIFNTYVWGPIARDPWWEITAFVGEVVFAGRFLLQWLISEIKKKSYIPISFWYMSIIGSAILVTYFIHKKQPVMIAAFTAQIFIYLRNLMLIRKNIRTSQAAICHTVNESDNSEERK
jgi:lipid-A-disaccharide synthase-like uncharacterized protein